MEPAPVPVTFPSSRPGWPGPGPAPPWAAVSSSPSSSDPDLPLYLGLDPSSLPCPQWTLTSDPWSSDRTSHPGGFCGGLLSPISALQGPAPRLPLPGPALPLPVRTLPALARAVLHPPWRPLPWAAACCHTAAEGVGCCDRISGSGARRFKPEA